MLHNCLWEGKGPLGGRGLRSASGGRGSFVQHLLSGAGRSGSPSDLGSVIVNPICPVGDTCPVLFTLPPWCPHLVPQQALQCSCFILCWVLGAVCWTTGTRSSSVWVRTFTPIAPLAFSCGQVCKSSSSLDPPSRVPPSGGRAAAGERRLSVLLLAKAVSSAVWSTGKSDLPFGWPLSTLRKSWV